MKSAVERVDKPWGYELRFVQTERFAGKVLFIKAGSQLSLQYHEHKDETIHVLKGEIVFRTRVDGIIDERRMVEGDGCHIVPRTIHQMEATITSDLLEVSTPELDDVVRLSDDFGREGSSAA